MNYYIITQNDNPRMVVEYKEEAEAIVRSMNKKYEGYGYRRATVADAMMGMVNHYKFVNMSNSN